ncbi:MAG: hypothetical protein ABFS32_18980 [Bacteroidota bacterium]
MKTLAYFLSILLLVGLASCENQFDKNEFPEGEFGFYITGISQSLDYKFYSGSRLSETPDDVRELIILILDENNKVVYEQYYFNHNIYMDQEPPYYDTTDPNIGDVIYYENAIPDTLFIPPLPAGNYDILASTTYLNYHHYYPGDPIIGEDGTVYPYPDNVGYPRIDPYTVSENPIYVGKESITLTEDKQEIVMGMRNISAKITLVREMDSTNTDTSDIVGGFLELMFSTMNNKYFSFEADSLLDQEYDYDAPIYTYLSYENKKHFYILPKTLTGATISFYHNSIGTYNFKMEVPFDPFIELQTNDAIAFSINVDDLLSSANSGTLIWKDITWNNLGEVSIP